MTGEVKKWPVKSHFWPVIVRWPAVILSPASSHDPLTLELRIWSSDIAKRVIFISILLYFLQFYLSIYLYICIYIYTLKYLTNLPLYMYRKCSCLSEDSRRFGSAAGMNWNRSEYFFVPASCKHLLSTSTTATKTKSWNTQDHVRPACRHVYVIRDI